MDHDRTGDGKVDVDSNFDNTCDPTFIPVAGLTPDERTIAEATRVSRSRPRLPVRQPRLGRPGRARRPDRRGHLRSRRAAAAGRDVQRTAHRRLPEHLRAGAKADGRWDRTVLIVTADHSMDWSLPTPTVSLTPGVPGRPAAARRSSSPRTAVRAVLAQGPLLPSAAERLRRMRAIALATPRRRRGAVPAAERAGRRRAHWVGRVHPDWHQTSARSGDLLVTVDDGRRVTEPTAVSNPIPGNHGMPSTLRVPMVVSGGLGVVQRTVTGSSDPAAGRGSRRTSTWPRPPPGCWASRRRRTRTPTPGTASTGGRSRRRSRPARPTGVRRAQRPPRRPPPLRARRRRARAGRARPPGDRARPAGVGRGGGPARSCSDLAEASPGNPTRPPLCWETGHPAGNPSPRRSPCASSL